MSLSTPRLVNITFGVDIKLVPTLEACKKPPGIKTTGALLATATDLDSMVCAEVEEGSTFFADHKANSEASKKGKYSDLANDGGPCSTPHAPAKVHDEQSIQEDIDCVADKCRP